MKITKEVEGKRVAVKMRTGGQYIGIIQKVNETQLIMQPDQGGLVYLSLGMISTLQLLVEEDNHD